METVIDNLTDNTEVHHTDDYALKLVLTNGLRRKIELCDESNLKKLMQRKHFSSTEDKKSLLAKVRQNLQHFTVEDIHGIIYIKPPKPVNIINQNQIYNEIRPNQKVLNFINQPNIRNSSIMDPIYNSQMSNHEDYYPQQKTQSIPNPFTSVEKGYGKNASMISEESVKLRKPKIVENETVCSSKSDLVPEFVRQKSIADEVNEMFKRRSLSKSEVHDVIKSIQETIVMDGQVVAE